MSIQPLETTPATTEELGHERVKGSTSGGRPMWLMWPSVILIVVIIGIPLLIAIYISFLYLNQYTLRQLGSCSLGWAGQLRVRLHRR